MLPGDPHTPSRSFDSAARRVQRIPSRSCDDVEAPSDGGSIDIERALKTYAPSRDEGQLARRAQELGLRGAHNKAKSGSPVAGRSVAPAPPTAPTAPTAPHPPTRVARPTLPTVPL